MSRDIERERYEQCLVDYKIVQCCRFVPLSLSRSEIGALRSEGITAFGGYHCIRRVSLSHEGSRSLLSLSPKPRPLLSLSPKPNPHCLSLPNQTPTVSLSQTRPLLSLSPKPVSLSHTRPLLSLSPKPVSLSHTLP